jgi:dipeptidase E
MKLLLTSQSICNPSIETALRELLIKPSDQCTALYITTSQNGAIGNKAWFVHNLNNAFNVGWKSFEVVDVAAMIDLPKEMWWDRIEMADVLFVGGGANHYLSYWFERSGLAESLNDLLQTKIYVGSSAGSIAVTNSLLTGSEALKQLAENGTVNLDILGPEGQRSPHAFKLVDVEFRPHYQVEKEKYAFITDQLLQEVADISGHDLYAVDDNSALKIVDNDIEVVSEGEWRRFKPIRKS